MKTPSHPTDLTLQPLHGLKGHGAITLAPDAGAWLPARTRITHIWVEDTLEGDRLVYCFVRDTPRCWIAVATLPVLVTGTLLFTNIMTTGILPGWLFWTVMVLFGAACSWTNIWYPEAGAGGIYPIDAQGHLLPKAKKPHFKGLECVRHRP